jgi:hypothetical protein
MQGEVAALVLYQRETSLGRLPRQQRLGPLLGRGRRGPRPNYTEAFAEDLGILQELGQHNA